VVAGAALMVPAPVRSVGRTSASGNLSEGACRCCGVRQDCWTIPTPAQPAGALTGSDARSPSRS